jgi:hypothetical protein
MSIRVIPFLFLLLLPAGFCRAAAKEAPKCDDAGKVYKVCGDQEAAYQQRLEAAKGENKLLVVAVGAEWCPWCQSLHKMLNDTAFAGGTFAQKYVLADVGVFNGKAKVPSGDAILDRIKAQAHYTKKIDGIPVLAVVNPKNGKAVLIDTEPLEHNTKTTKGHDPRKVRAALDKAALAVR